MKFYCVTLAALATAVSLNAGAALAQSSDSKVKPSVKALSALQSEADVDGGGTVSSARWAIQPGVSFGPTPVHSFGLNVGLGGTTYDFDGTGPDDTVSVRELSIAAPLRFPVSQRAVALIIPSVSYRGEEGTSLSDGMSTALISSVTWRVSDNLLIGPGVIVAQNIRDETKVVPFGFVFWTITPQWWLRTGDGLPGNRGPAVSLSYGPSDDWTFSLIGQRSQFEFLLDDGDGSIRDSSQNILLSAEWSPDRNLKLTAFAGMARGGQITTYDDDGDKTSEQDYDPAGVFGLAAEIRF